MDAMGIIISISQKQKVRFNDFHNLQLTDHPASKWQSQGQTPNLSNPKIHGVLFIADKQEGTAVTTVDYLGNLGIPVPV